MRVLLLFVLLGLSVADPPTCSQKPLRKSYDFIVVGAGTAGTTVAARLAEDKRVSVLLVEAGPETEERGDVHMPGAVATLQKGNLDWQFKTTKQENCCDAIDNVGHWPRGKGVGGTSNLNYMLWTRGSRGTYDRWAEDFGAVGWSWKDVEPYFIRMEDATALGENVHPTSRGFSGPIKVENPIWRAEYHEALLQTQIQDGMVFNKDYNGENPEGVSVTQLNTFKGKRWTPAVAHLYGKQVSNLEVLANAMVTRVVFDNEGVSEPIATGVAIKLGKTTEEQQAAEEIIVSVRRDVILSAGSIGTPQLLMVSGVGPKADLEKLDIPVIKDLPGVGQGLEDHVMICQSWQSNKETILATSGTPENVNAWMKGEGILTGSGLSQVSWFHTGARPDLKQRNIPDIEVLVADFGCISVLFDALVGVKKDHLPAESQRDTHGVSLCSMLTQPESVGEIKLASKSVFDAPLLNPKYLSASRDAESLRRGIQRVFNFMNRSIESGPLKGILGDHIRYGNPHPVNSDAYWDYQVRNWPITVYHPSCTAKMGPKSDPKSVVSPVSLKVHGTRNLRVVDASIHPTVVAAHPHAPTVMCGEKAADIIKNDYK